MPTLTHYQIICEHMHHSMMNKSVHVHYTAQKCFLLRNDLIQSASRYREDAALLTPLQNRQYRLVKSIKSDSEGEKNTLHERQLLSLANEQFRLTGTVQQQLSDMASGLMRSADTLLFTLLKAQHYQWRDRLYMALLTDQPDSVLAGENDCPLGQWLHAEGARRFYSLPGFRSLREAHHEMHQAVEQLFDTPLTSKLPTVLKRQLQRTEDASQQLISVLDGLEKMVVLLYPEQSPDPQCRNEIQREWG
ncbi:CZB domain-containing protein [Salmonella enterica]|nr:hypothetical protein [Salmonella enterica]EGZ4032505.1 hypothetical protein [Salmonella enterica subsp. enterica serovar Javiana]HCX7090129.1 CZB domain-containing protein [Salmonella enterica subsp. enterica]ECE1413809.1 hypothetical protein [Salmonella enterica]ELS7235298.1 CZB domain-containing protein [Salmonella enterica]